MREILAFFLFFFLVSTTGTGSSEVFDHRDTNNSSHSHDNHTITIHAPHTYHNSSIIVMNDSGNKPANITHDIMARGSMMKTNTSTTSSNRESSSFVSPISPQLSPAQSPFTLRRRPTDDLQWTSCSEITDCANCTVAYGRFGYVVNGHQLMPSYFYKHAYIHI